MRWHGMNNYGMIVALLLIYSRKPAEIENKVSPNEDFDIPTTFDICDFKWSVLVTFGWIDITFVPPD